MAHSVLDCLVSLRQKGNQELRMGHSRKDQYDLAVAFCLGVGKKVSCARLHGFNSVEQVFLKIRRENYNFLAKSNFFTVPLIR